MPVFLVNNRKYLSANDDKTKNVVFEYASEMTLSDLLERVEEFEKAIKEGMRLEEESKKENAQKENPGVSEE